MIRFCRYIFAVLLVQSAVLQGQTVRIGSKSFTESVILGEMITQLGSTAGGRVVHRKGIGGTRLLWNALLSGEIDAYPEYTGTIIQEILSGQSIVSSAQLAEALRERGIGMSEPLGFNNTYALGMTRHFSDSLRIQKISDLQKFPDIKFGFTNEFMDRADGWPALQKAYQLPQRDVRGLDHDLAYRALAGGDIQVMDLYSTDAEIHFYALKTLVDDLHLFPDYHAVLLYRLNLAQKNPAVVSAWRRLEHRITESDMISMNARVKIKGLSETEVAADFISSTFSIAVRVEESTFWSRLWRNTLDHLVLVALSLSGAILVAIPLGVWSYKRPQVGRVVLSAVGIVQTIPSLALLVFMIPLLGIGSAPAIAALFLYSLLPIVRNTHAGLQDIPSSLKESAEALGLEAVARMRLVEMPLATRSILAGIKTSAVINVGTATLGALIGAGGYGQPILTGIRLDSMSLIAEGAVPAAILAIVVQQLFDALEQRLVPMDLRLKRAA